MKWIEIVFLLVLSLVSRLGHSQCQNLDLFPAENVIGSAFSDTVLVTTQQHAGQYYVASQLTLGETYLFLSSNSGDYLSIRDVYDPSILIAHGASPLSVAIPPGGPDLVAVHINLASPPCGSDTLDRTTLFVCTTCPAFPPVVGAGTTEPQSSLDVAGKIRLGYSQHPAQAGMVRWNPTALDFEGYDGTKWISLTKSNATWGSIPSTLAHESAWSTPASGQAQGQFGHAVCMDADYAIVGAAYEDIGNNPNQGAAYIFKRTGNTWSEQMKLTASDGAADDYFGYSVSLSGDYAIIGAHQDNIGSNANQGSAYIFKRNGNSWSQQVKLTASDGAAEDYFGVSASISGEYAIVAAHVADVVNSSDQGVAYIFKRNGASWIEQAKLTSSDGGPNDYFGYSVSISGDYAIVGAPFNNIGNVQDQGAAYIFKRSGSTWPEQAILVASDGAADDYFGYSVSISGDYALVGASFDNIGSNQDQGSAYIFNRSGTSWPAQQKLTASDGMANDIFGVHVSLSGEFALIGAYQHDMAGVPNEGAAYTFKRTGSTWAMQSKLAASDGKANDNVGISVALSAEYAAIGASKKDVGANTDQGAVYFFSKNE